MLRKIICTNAPIDSSFLPDNAPGQLYVFCQYLQPHTPGKQTLNPPRPAQIRSKLVDYRLASPLFDTPCLTDNLETAYTAIYDQYQAGLRQGHIRF
jgi:hypothetical protein